MDLLLLLTAIFASLTGAASGDRAGAMHSLRGVAAIHAAETVQAAAQPAKRALPAVALPALSRRARVVLPRLAAAPLVPFRLAFERRLE